MALNQPLVCEVVIGLGLIPLAPYGTPGTPELARTLEPLVPQYDAILMANHGVVTYDVLVTNNGPRPSDDDLDLTVSLSPYLSDPGATGDHWQFAGSRVGGASLGMAAAAASGPTVAGTYPLVLGVGKGENFLASDVSAIVAYTRDAVYLNDFDVVAAGTDKFEITSLAGDSTEHPVSKVEFTAEDIRKGDFPHYMLKEIFEQPNTVRDAMRGRLNHEECTARLGGLNMAAPQLRDVGRIVLIGCGTALHAGRIGEYLIERLANIPTEVDYGSEFRYRDPILEPNTLTVVISQSGETADTLAAQREAKQKGSKTVPPGGQ